jgi:hypothetical protein
MTMPTIMAIIIITTMITGTGTIIMTMITSIIIRMVNLIDTVITGITTMTSVENGQVHRAAEPAANVCLLGTLP